MDFYIFCITYLYTVVGMELQDAGSITEDMVTMGLAPTTTEVEVAPPARAARRARAAVNPSEHNKYT